MNILVVNDDGYQAEGLETLVRAMAVFGTVYVSAPKEGQSAKSMSITIKKRIKVFYPTPIIGSKQTIAVDGTPADCVGVALKAFNVDFDLCVSGINHGHNVAHDILYSGTVGAAREAKLKDIPSIAFSSGYSNATYLYDETVKLMDEILASKIHLGSHILNINFPNSQTVAPKGVKITKIGKRFQYSDFQVSNDEHEFIPNYSVKRYIEDEDSDVFAINQGYVSITPLKFDSTDTDAIESMMKEA
jgi:5'-nucleotidase